MQIDLSGRGWSTLRAVDTATDRVKTGATAGDITVRMKCRYRTLCLVLCRALLEYAMIGVRRACQGDVELRDRIEELLADQLRYYRARAPIYDTTYQRTGDYDRGEPANNAWRADLEVVADRLAEAQLGGRTAPLT